MSQPPTFIGITPLSEGISVEPSGQNLLIRFDKPVPKPSLDNPLALTTSFTWSEIDLASQTDDLTILCAGRENVKTNRILLARSSVKLAESLLKEPPPWTLDLQEYGRESVELLLEMLEGKVISDCQCREIDPRCHLVQVIKMAQEYQIIRILVAIKVYLIKVRPTLQIHFDLDKTYQLGLRKDLVQAAYLSFDQAVLTKFTDPTIYKELGDLIFKVPVLDQVELTILRRRQLNFVHNFLKSGLHYEDLEFKLAGCPSALAVQIFSTCSSDNFGPYLVRHLESAKAYVFDPLLRAEHQRVQSSAEYRIKLAKEKRQCEATQEPSPKREKLGDELTKN